mgnify:CR=1 FL=1
MRAFVAIMVPAGTAARLGAAMVGVAGVRWQSAEQLHLTLRFLGDVEPPVLEDLADELERIDMPRFDVALRGAGLFGEGGRANSLWVGVAPNPVLERLHAKVERCCLRVGLAGERRTFLPHVTIARFARSTPSPTDFVARHTDRDWGTMPVDRFALVESVPGRDGSRYGLLATIRLKDECG